MNERRLYSMLRTIAAVVVLVVPAACTGGINAGVQGGRAFIALTIVLLAVLAILWFVLGREK